MSQSSPFAAPALPAQFSPAAPPPPPPPSPSRWRELLHSRVALVAGAGIVLAGGAGAWLLLGSGGGDDPALGQPLVPAAHSAGASGSAFGSASVLPSAAVDAGAVRNPFAGAPGAPSPAAVVPTPATVPSAGPTTAPSAVPSGAVPSGVVPSASPSLVANPTVTVTATRTVTATPSPSPAAVYVYLVGWIAGTQADLRINLLSAQADPGTTVDGVTYVRQNPTGSSGVCATVKLAGAADSTEQTVCPSAVVQLR